MENISTTSTILEEITTQNSPSLENWLLQNSLMTSSIQELGLSTNVDPAETKKLDVISIEDLLNTSEIIKLKEEADKQNIQSFFTPTTDSLRPALLAWAKNGFPPVEKILTQNLEAPSLCSDGQRRTTPYYIEYLLKTTIGEKLQGINQKTQGMTFTYSWTDTSISLHVTRN